MTLQELVDRALTIASAGMEPSLSPTLNAEMLAEDVMPQVFAEVGVRLAHEERTRHLLRRLKTLAVVNGSVALSADVLSAYITDSVLFDPATITRLYAYLPWEYFSRETLDSRLGHYSVAESVLYVTQPGSNYVPGSGPTISLSLAIPCVPEVPALATDNVIVTEEVADELTAALAKALVPLMPKFRQVSR